MYSEISFVRDFIKAYRCYDRSDKTANAIQLCYKTYLNSSTAALRSLVVGRIVKPATSSNQLPMVGLDDIERINFGTTGDRSTGSVLWNKYWSIPLNDSWLMGGIHAGFPFYLASPREIQNIEDKKFGFTVTGRELIGLLTFGYELNPNTTLGEVFECKNRPKAIAATFAKYEAAVQQAKNTPNFWKKLVP